MVDMSWSFDNNNLDIKKPMIGKLYILKEPVIIMKLL